MGFDSDSHRFPIWFFLTEGRPVRSVGVQRSFADEGRAQGVRALGGHCSLHGRVRIAGRGGVGEAEPQTHDLAEPPCGRRGLRHRHGAGRRMCQRLSVQGRNGKRQLHGRAPGNRVGGGPGVLRPPGQVERPS